MNCNSLFAAVFVFNWWSLILIGSLNVTVWSEYLPLDTLPRHRDARQLIIPSADTGSTGNLFLHLFPYFLEITYIHVPTYLNKGRKSYPTKKKLTENKLQIGCRYVSIHINDSKEFHKIMFIWEGSTNS